MSDLLNFHAPGIIKPQLIECDYRAQWTVSPDFLWRVDGSAYGDMYLYAGMYSIKHYTPTGAVVSAFGKDHFVCWSWHKKWAHKTLQEALISFKARKVANLNILEAQRKSAEYNLRLVEEILNDRSNEVVQSVPSNTGSDGT